jgi:hypothetical protein
MNLAFKYWPYETWRERRKQQKRQTIDWHVADEYERLVHDKNSTFGLERVGKTTVPDIRVRCNFARLSFHIVANRLIGLISYRIRYYQHRIDLVLVTNVSSICLIHRDSTQFDYVNVDIVHCMLSLFNVDICSLFIDYLRALALGKNID